jgi:hypothetical protein
MDWEKFTSIGIGLEFFLQVLELDWEKLTTLGNGLGKIYRSWKWTGKN